MQDARYHTHPLECMMFQDETFSKTRGGTHYSYDFFRYGEISSSRDVSIHRGGTPQRYLALSPSSRKIPHTLQFPLPVVGFTSRQQQPTTQQLFLRILRRPQLSCPTTHEGSGARPQIKESECEPVLQSVLVCPNAKKSAQGE